MNISASKVAVLIGANPFESIHLGWVYCLKQHDNKLYRALVKHDSHFILPHEKASHEISSMPKDEQAALKKAKTDVLEGRSTPMEAFKGFKLSDATMKTTISQSMCSVGTNQEATGLQMTAKSNGESAQVLKKEAQILQTNLLEQRVKQDELTTDISETKKTLERVEATKQELQQELHKLQDQKDKTQTSLTTSEQKLNELKRKFDEGDTTMAHSIASETQLIEKIKTDIQVHEEKAADATAKYAEANKTAQETENKLQESLTLNAQIKSSIDATETKITENLTEAEIFELPIQTCSKPFKFERESFVLTGKIDGLRKHGDLIYIIEHKRRQKRLFQSVKLYEKIQCMCYMKLIMNEHPDKLVRCLLTETFKGTEANHEILFDPIWMDSILEFLATKSAELLCLAAAADVHGIANWMHALQGLSNFSAAPSFMKL